MKPIKAILAVITIILSALFSAQAVPISGLLNIGGTADFDTNSLATASSATFTNVTVQGGNTGDFAGLVIGTPVTMAAYIFDPSTIINGLWSVGGFAFNLTSSTVFLPRSTTFLSISGTGFVTGPPGFDPTPGVWAFTSQDPGGVPHATFSFSANTEAQGRVPDNGATLLLLGVGLIGLAALPKLQES